MNRYTPDPCRQRYGDQTCTHCGTLAFVHHSDGRCYTTAEMAARLRLYQRTGQWPAQDAPLPEEDIP